MHRITRIGLLLIIVIAAASGATWAAPAAPANSVVGNGTPGSCTQGALATALAGGSLVTFNCGGPKTILFSGATTLIASAILDGGGLITLTGNLAVRLFNVPPGLSFTLRNITLDLANRAASPTGPPPSAC